MTINVHFLGTGSASAPGGRTHSAILVRHERGALLLDCGTLAAITRVIDPADIDAVFVTHLHGDHFGALPFLLMHQRFAARKRELPIFGPRELAQRLHDLSVALYTDFYAEAFPFAFPISVFEQQERDITGAGVTTVPVVHMRQSDAYGVRVRIGGALIAYSGDAEWSDAIPALADGADLFICEATTYEAKWRGHLSASELAMRRNELRCKRVILTHLGPEAVARRDEITLEVAEDGMAITL
jgi:ribonuclease BN (tRNA processing enzyme)